MDETTEAPARDVDEPVISFRDVHLSFDRPILAGVSFDLRLRARDGRRAAEATVDLGVPGLHNVSNALAALAAAPALEHEQVEQRREEQGAERQPQPVGAHGTGKVGAPRR